jgi:hypothetical protein
LLAKMNNIFTTTYSNRYDSAPRSGRPSTNKQFKRHHSVQPIRSLNRSLREQQDRQIT